MKIEISPPCNWKLARTINVDDIYCYEVDDWFAQNLEYAVRKELSKVALRYAKIMVPKIATVNKQKEKTINNPEVETKKEIALCLATKSLF